MYILFIYIYKYCFTINYYEQGEIIRIHPRDSTPLLGHSNYIQGVAWDPIGDFVVTQSADRSVKLHPVCIIIIFIYFLYCLLYVLQ